MLIWIWVGMWICSFSFVGFGVGLLWLWSFGWVVRVLSLFSLRFARVIDVWNV